MLVYFLETLEDESDKDVTVKAGSGWTDMGQ